MSTSPATLGRRERKKLETRRALQDAALRLTLDHGLSKVTVEEIAEAADVSVRTFFNYFATKEDAIVGDDPDRPEQLRAAVLARPHGEQPLMSLRAVLVEMAEQMMSDDDPWERRLRVIKTHPELLTAHLAAWSRLERVLVEAIAARTGTDPDEDLYPGVVVAAAVGANRVAALRWRGTRTRSGPSDVPARSLSALVGEAIDALATGLRAPTPRTR